MQELHPEVSREKLAECVHSLDFECQHSGEAVKTELLYLPMRNGEQDVRAFLDFVKSHVISKFASSYRDIVSQYTRKDLVEAETRLLDKAIRKFSRHTAKGKIGELMLYLFLDVLMDAPKLISKISTLDNCNMHVKGADALHASFSDGELTLYLGEAKMYKNYPKACTDAINSLKDSLATYQTEFDLIETLLDIPYLDAISEDWVLRVLDPYENQDYIDRVKMVCFIGHDDSLCASGKSTREFAEEYRCIAQAKIDEFYSRVSGKFDLEKVVLFALPFASIDEFTSSFLDTMGIIQ